MKRLIRLVTLVMLVMACMGGVAYANNNPLDIYIPEETFVVSQEDYEDDGDYEDWESDPDNGEELRDSGYTEDELYLAAQLIYREGKNQSDESFEAMASVVYNRVKSKRFPATIEKVVFQKNQFTVTRDREEFLEAVPSEAARAAIYKVFVEGNPTVPPEVMFFKSGSLSKKWGSRVYYDTIGNNMYYS